MDELKTLGTFGLRTKRELWKAHTELSRVRHQARSLLALRQEVRAEKEPILMNSLARIGLVSNDATLDDVLNLNATDLLSRRLQTIVTRKFGFKTPYQARQAVIHGHIMIGERKVNIPSYTVTIQEEGNVHFAPESKIPEMLEKTKKDDPVEVAVTEDAVEVTTKDAVEVTTKDAVEVTTKDAVEATTTTTATAAEDVTEATTTAAKDEKTSTE